MKPATRLARVLIAAALAPLTAASAQEAPYSRYVSPWKTPWDYGGPRGSEHWSELDPGYAVCNRGREQSPVDIRASRRADLPPLVFAYASAPVGYVINNAHTIRVDYHDAPGGGSALLVDGKRYQLTQFHFHRPSEELIAGRRYAMVVHLMHTAGDGEVAGVAVLVTAGRANQAIGELWRHLPQSEGQLPVPDLSINPAQLLPRETGYYLYSGSVTAPPCTEGVKWFVLKQPLELSREQIATFARLYPDDVRPPQPLNGRVVLESRR
jgi:carbonic anhydrase